MGITDFKKHIKESTKMTKEYKTYLAVMRDEGSDWYEASKTVMEYLHPNDKLTRKDYESINKLRKWYEDTDTEV